MLSFHLFFSLSKNHAHLVQKDLDSLSKFCIQRYCTLSLLMVLISLKNLNLNLFLSVCFKCMLQDCIQLYAQVLHKYNWVFFFLNATIYSQLRQPSKFLFRGWNGICKSIINLEDFCKIILYKIKRIVNIIQILLHIESEKNM